MIIYSYYPFGVSDLSEIPLHPDSCISGKISIQAILEASQTYYYSIAENAVSVLASLLLSLFVYTISDILHTKHIHKSLKKNPMLQLYSCITLRELFLPSSNNLRSYELELKSQKIEC